LARFRRFNDSDIVFAWTGGNDFLVQSRDPGPGSDHTDHGGGQHGNRWLKEFG
jgi:hypothetical protein